MAKISLDIEAEKGLELLFSLSNAVFDEILQELDRVNSDITFPETIDLLSKFVKTHDEALVLLRIFNNLIRLKYETKRKIDQIIKDIETESKEFNNESINKNFSATYLQKIFAISGPYFVSMIGKYEAYNRDKILGKTEIITESRPLFFENSIKGMVILHTLKIDYTDSNGEHNSIFLALDTSDLQNLENEIATARIKENEFRKSISIDFTNY